MTLDSYWLGSSSGACSSPMLAMYTFGEFIGQFEVETAHLPGSTIGRTSLPMRFCPPDGHR